MPLLTLMRNLLGECVLASCILSRSQVQAVLDGQLLTLLLLLLLFLVLSWLVLRDMLVLRGRGQGHIAVQVWVV